MNMEVKDEVISLPWTTTQEEKLIKQIKFCFINEA